MVPRIEKQLILSERVLPGGCTIVRDARELPPESDENEAIPELKLPVMNFGKQATEQPKQEPVPVGMDTDDPLFAAEDDPAFLNEDTIQNDADDQNVPELPLPKPVFNKTEPGDSRQAESVHTDGDDENIPELKLPGQQ